MATINIRSVPEHLKEWIRSEASARGMTMRAFLIHVFEDGYERGEERERFRIALERLRDEAPNRSKRRGRTQSSK